MYNGIREWVWSFLGRQFASFSRILVVLMFGIAPLLLLTFRWVCITWLFQTEEWTKPCKEINYVTRQELRLEQTQFREDRLSAPSATAMELFHDGNQKRRQTGVLKMTTPILLSHYTLIFMSLCPMECRGWKNQEIKGTSPDPLPPSGSQKGGGGLRETSKLKGVAYM